MLKISEQYLDFYKSYCKLIKNLAYWVAYLSRETVNLVKGRPLITQKIQLISNNFYINQDIALKFSAYVYHMSALNWQKNFWHYSIGRSAAPPSVPKLLMPLATIFVEIFSKKFFWWGSRPISATPWKEFWISWKKWRFEIFGTSLPSRQLQWFMPKPSSIFF